MIDAALHVLERDGPGGLTLRGVARQLGISAPSIYLHFADRNALMAAALVEEFRRFDTALKAAFATADDPIERLYSGCTAYCTFALAHPGAYEVLFSGRVQAALGETEEYVTIGLDTFQTLIDGVAATEPHEAAAVIAQRIWIGLHGMAALRSALPLFPWEPLENEVRRLIDDRLESQRPSMPSPP